MRALKVKRRPGLAKPERTRAAEEALGTQPRASHQVSMDEVDSARGSSVAVAAMAVGVLGVAIVASMRR